MNPLPIPDSQWQSAFDKLHNASDDRKLIVGRLGVKTSTSSANLAVAERAGYYYVSTGLNGELGQAQARDGVGVALTAWQTIWMVREAGELVICRATNYGGGAGGGGASNLDALTDVTLTTPANGNVLAYNSATSQWINVVPAGGASGAPSPHAHHSAHHSGLLPWTTDIDFTGSDLANIVTRPHSTLQGINPNDHHHIAQSGAGITVDGTTQVVDITLAANSGLIATGGLRLNPTVAGAGLTLTSGIMDVAVGPGLLVDTTTITLNPLLSGLGLTLTSGVLDVGAGDGIDSFTDTIAVDVTDFVDTTRGLYEPTTNDIGVRLETNSGFQFGGAGGVQLGTPSTLAVASVNSVTTNTHSHAITSSSDQQFGGAALLASNSSGFLALAQLTLRGGLIFAGGDQSITASNKLSIMPAQDLLLDPGGLVLTPNAQDVRTVTINDLPTGIDGFRLWNRYSNYTQLSIGAIKADELYVRVFTADETRIDRGEEYWSKSFGIVQSDFNLPAVGATVDVWFEDAPAAVTFNLFAVNDYLLMRTIDWTTGLVVQKVWFQVTVAKLAQETTAANGVDRQQWRIRRLAGGSTGLLIKRGNLALDSGAIGQGWIHLSALSQDGGPFIQIGTMTSVATVPQFTNYVRMGNLNGTVDYATNVYGFAAGSSLGTTPSGGFSGMTAEATNGLRLFNTTLELYEAGNKVVRLAAGTGLAFEKNSLGVTSAQVAWYDDLGAVAGAAPPGTPMASISLGRALAAVENSLNISSGNGGVGGNLGSILMQASQTGAIMGLYLEPGNLHIYGTDGITDRLTVTNAGLVGIGNATPAQKLDVRGAGANTIIRVGFNTTNSVHSDWFAAVASTGMYSINDATGLYVPFALSASALNFNLGTTNIVTMDSSGVAVAATLFVGDGSTQATIQLNGSVSTNKQLTFSTNNSLRWIHRVAGAESGSNSGSDFSLVSRTDAGGVLRTDLAIARNTGAWVTGGDLSIGGDLAVAAQTANDGIYVSNPSVGGPFIYLDATNATVANRFNGVQMLSGGTAQWLTGLRSGDGKMYMFDIVNNIARQVWQPNGNVGIGITAPTSRLHIVTATANDGVYVACSGVGGPFFILDATNATASNRFAGLVMASNGVQQWAAEIRAGDGKFHLVDTIAALSRQVWQPDGKIGMGTTTPAAALDVVGVIRTTAVTNAPTTGTGLQMYYSGASGTGFGSIAAYTPATPTFEELRIDGSLLKLNASSNGQVGVGTANPVGALGVEASAQTGISSTIYSSNFNTFIGQPHLMARSARGTKAAITNTAGGDAILALESYGFNSSAAWMTVPSVAIYGRASETFNSGQTNGGASLEVYVRATATAGAPAAPVFSILGGTLVAGTSDTRGDATIYGDLIINAKGESSTSPLLGGQLQIINMKTTATAATCGIEADGTLHRPGSSRRFKTQIRALPEAYGAEFVMKLKPSIFKARDAEAEGDLIGLIAEEVLEAGGEPFTWFDAEGRVEGLRYENLTAPLIATVQQQQGRIVELERKLAELERRLLN